MTNDIALNGRGGQIAQPAPNAALDEFELLDSYAGGVADEPDRIDALATISAGEKVTENGKTFPRASRDGRIFLHDRTGRAPGLRAALEAGDWKRLTIAFPFNDPRAFVQQRFLRYSASAPEAYGDQHEITVLSKDGRATYQAGTAEYRDQVARCKVHVSLYFTLATWIDGNPVVTFPDGLGSLYRLRFTSRNSLRAIVGTLKYVARFTQGRVAGIPFDLALDYREVAGPDGAKRLIPVWTIQMRPPGDLSLTSANFQRVVTGALAQGAALMLPPPRAETLELAAAEGPDVDLDAEVLEATDQEAAALADGGFCDADHYTKRWHALASGTRFDDDTARALFLARFTHGKYRSLAAYLNVATDSGASRLIAELETAIAAEKRPEQHLAPRERSGSGVGIRGERWVEGDEGDYAEVFGQPAPAPAQVIDQETGEIHDTAEPEGAPTEFAPDPIREQAEAAIAALRERAETTTAPPGEASRAQHRAVAALLTEQLGLARADAEAVLRHVFALPPGGAVLSARQAAATVGWATADMGRAKRDAAAMVASVVGQEALL